MEYVVYHIKSTQLLKSFSSVSSAKRSMTCMNRNAGSFEYQYADREYYDTKIVHNKKVTNLMTGQEIEIPSNTPASCDPSRETYWVI